MNGWSDEITVSDQRAAATATATSSASVAVIADDNCRLGNLFQRKRSDVQRFAAAVGDRQIEHLIEVTVVNPTVPTNTDQDCGT